MTDKKETTKRAEARRADLHLANARQADRIAAEAYARAVALADTAPAGAGGVRARAIMAHCKDTAENATVEGRAAARAVFDLRGEAYAQARKALLAGLVDLGEVATMAETAAALAEAWGAVAEVAADALGRRAALMAEALEVAAVQAATAHGAGGPAQGGAAWALGQAEAAEARAYDVGAIALGVRALAARLTDRCRAETSPAGLEGPARTWAGRRAAARAVASYKAWAHARQETPEDHEARAPLGAAARFWAGLASSLGVYPWYGAVRPLRASADVVEGRALADPAAADLAAATVTPRPAQDMQGAGAGRESTADKGPEGPEGAR